MTLTLDAKRSGIRIRTFAEGLFSRLAHDLELVCREPSGTGHEEELTCTITIPVHSIDVAGTLKGGKVDATVLSPSDCEDILGKMRREVFHGGDTISIEASMAPPRAKVTSPNGKTIEVPVRAVSSKEDGSIRVKGKLDISLSAFGSDPVKGPMNAFRVKDTVEVEFDVWFQPA